MHGRFDKPAKIERPAKAANDSHQTGVRLLILSIFILATVIILAIIQPVTSNWIAEAVEAEFGGDQLLPRAPSPTQFAQPAAVPHSQAPDWIRRMQTAWRGQR